MRWESARRLRIDDYITSTHRGHGHCLAKGASPDRMFAELLGKEAGYCRGKGGSMHIADPATGNLGANAIVGGSVGIATGAAFSAKNLGTDRVAVCFFGEGALGQGSLYEVMNLAQLVEAARDLRLRKQSCTTNTPTSRKRLRERFSGGPMLSALRRTWSTGRMCEPYIKSLAASIKRARSGAGPAFLQCDTYRYSGHHVGDINREYYRPKQEEQLWKTERDPIGLLGHWLIERGDADAASLEQISQQVRGHMEAAVKFAIDAPYPDVDEVEQDVYA